MIFEGIEIEVQCKPVRGLRLAIRRDGSARLSIPWGASERTVMDFLEKNSAWLHTKAAEVRARYEEQQATVNPRYETGEKFTCWGKIYLLQIVEGGGSAHVSVEGRQLVLSSAKVLSTKQRAAAINAWYARQLRERVGEMLPYWLATMGEGPLQKVRFKRMTSRWGSCLPAQRIICLNTRLVFYPEDCLEEVIVHELCHLKEPSHNAHFHALMSHYLPDYKERSARLRGNPSL